jgi:hydrogenase expression/formation protein HypC
MCLAIPGKIVDIGHREDEMIMGKVSFGGLEKEICLSYVPDAKVGDFVIVHVGFAISKIDHEEARRVFDYLEQMGETEEIKTNSE